MPHRSLCSGPRTTPRARDRRAGPGERPADAFFDTVAAEYRIDVPDAVLDPTRRALLRIRWTGDVARAYVGDTLVSDQFFSGRPWDIALDRLPGERLRTSGLRIRVLPLSPDARVHLPERAAQQAYTTAVSDAEVIVARVLTIDTA
ncbi:hypothetical protein O1M54_22585 [Streptomyces diastatochromogenes]|nr:hypothetical protein [Streptomyces diastatochromogenes]